jgi:hypothetical protein
MENLKPKPDLQKKTMCLDKSYGGSPHSGVSIGLFQTTEITEFIAEGGEIAADVAQIVECLPRMY